MFLEGIIKKIRLKFFSYFSLKPKQKLLYVIEKDQRNRKLLKKNSCKLFHIWVQKFYSKKYVQTKSPVRRTRFIFFFFFKGGFKQNKRVDGDKASRRDERWEEGKLITITKREVTHYGHITSVGLISVMSSGKGFHPQPPPFSRLTLRFFSQKCNLPRQNE